MSERTAWAAVLLVLVLICPALGGPAAATWSFGAGDNATCPATVAAGSAITVDLSALPAGAKVFRAVLRCERQSGPGWQREGDKAVVTPSESAEALALLAPRYASFDATAAVAKAVAAGAGEVGFQVKALSGWKRETTRLDVSFTGGTARPKNLAVKSLTATHRSGQTILHWAGPAPVLKDEAPTVADFRAARNRLAKSDRKITYRIYRHTGPIDAKTIARAQLVDEVGQLTGWNAEFHGNDPPKTAKLLRYVVADGAKPVAPGTGIYAHNPASAGKAWYAVSVAVNGEESFAGLGKADTVGPVDETVGPGDPILQRIEKPEKFFYTAGITLHYYTRWEAPPRHNLPSRPYDYLVTIPAKPDNPAPLNLILHCWGSNLYGKGGAYSWHSWQDKTRGIGVASNQIPYDWWTCYHENRGTWKPWTDGVNRDFTATRLLAFVDWVGGKWPVDKARMCVSGESMGGSGSTFIPIRYPGRFAYAYSAVGIHNPAAITGGFHESYARVVGTRKADLPHTGGRKVWDYLNDPKIVREKPALDLPFIGFGNGKNDHGIGWPHAVDLAKALQQARQPHAVIWRLRGHGSGTFYPRIKFRSDQSLPAFTGCSLDDDIGTATKLAEPVDYKLPWGQVAKDIYDGAREGQINTYLRWKTDDVVDLPERWEMTVYLTGGKGGAPEDACTVNITPRRLQKLKVAPGAAFAWTNTSVKAGEVVQTGRATPDVHGRVTLEKVTVTKDRNRIKLVAAGR